jgi:hypothetical protein
MGHGRSNGSSGSAISERTASIPPARRVILTFAGLAAYRIRGEAATPPWKRSRNSRQMDHGVPERHGKMN